MASVENGYGDLVIMSIQTYEQMLEVNQTDAAITEAESETSGTLIDAREALTALRRKHFG